MNREPENRRQRETQEESAVVEGDVTGNLEALINAMPEGWSRAQVDGHSWGVTRTTRADGRVITFNAERLGGTEALGANVWITSHGAVLRPCEIPAETIWGFLRDAADQARPARPTATGSASDSIR
ncbi:hypothetical protein AB0N64_04970 [Microbacterium sp. NPDC089318]